MISHSSYKHDTDHMFFDTVIKAIPYLFLGDDPEFREDLVRDLRNTFHKLRECAHGDPELVTMIKQIGTLIESHPENRWGSIQKGEIIKFKPYLGSLNKAFMSKLLSEDEKILHTIRSNPQGIKQRDAIGEILCIGDDVIRDTQAARFQGTITDTARHIKSLESRFSHLKKEGKITNINNCWYLTENDT